MTAKLSPIAQRLLAARKAGTPTTLEPALVPANHAAAMAVQAEVKQALGERVGGWKVGIGGDGVPFAAPLFESVLMPSPASLRVGGHVLIEMEIAVRLGRDLPPGEHTREAILAAIDSAIAGIEVLRGRAGEPPAAAFLAFLADNGANAAYVIGDASMGFRNRDLTALPCRLVIDGTVVHEKIGGHPQNDPIEPIRAYLANANDRLGGLKAGQVVTTGSLNKPVRVEQAARVEVAIEGIGRARLDLIA